VLPATPVRQSITGSDADDSVKHTSNTSRPPPVANPTEPALFCQRLARTTSHHFHPSTPLGILSRPFQLPSPASSLVHDVGGVQSLFQVPIALSAHSLPRDKQHCQDLRTKTAPIQATSTSPPTTSHIHHHGAQIRLDAAGLPRLFCSAIVHPARKCTGLHAIILLQFKHGQR